MKQPLRCGDFSTAPRLSPILVHGSVVLRSTAGIGDIRSPVPAEKSAVS